MSHFHFEFNLNTAPSLQTFSADLLRTVGSFGTKTSKVDVVNLCKDEEKTTATKKNHNQKIMVQIWWRIHRMIKLGLSIDDDDEGLGDDDDLPPLEEVEGAADEASKMEEVDWKEAR